MVGKKLQGLVTFSHWVVAFISDISFCTLLSHFFAIVQHRRQLEFLCSNSPLLRMKSRNSKNDLNISIEDVFHLVSHIPTSMLCSPTYASSLTHSLLTLDVNSIKGNREKDRFDLLGARGEAKKIRPFSKFIRIQKCCWNTLRPGFCVAFSWWAGMVVIAMWKWS